MKGRQMEKILSKRAVAISEFKRAPNEIVAEAKRKLAELRSRWTNKKS
jgi:ubiquitin